MTSLTPKPGSEMIMRLRYFELPSEVDGDNVHTPYLLILDRCGSEPVSEKALDRCRAIPGVQDVLLFPGEVQLGED